MNTITNTIHYSSMYDVSFLHITSITSAVCQTSATNPSWAIWNITPSTLTTTIDCLRPGYNPTTYLNRNAAYVKSFILE
jgi:hypothetical protein